MSIIEDPKRNLISFIIIAIAVVIAAGIFFDFIDNYSDREWKNECCNDFYKFGMMHASLNISYHCNDTDYCHCYDRGYQAVLGDNIISQEDNTNV